MSKYLFTALLAVAISAPAFGQSTTTTKRKHSARPTSETSTTVGGDQTAPSDFALGFHLGPNIGIASMNQPVTNANVDTGGNTGIAMGLTFETKLAHYIYLQPELNWVQRGSTTTTKAAAPVANQPAPAIVANTQTSTDLSYIEIPVFFKAKYTDHLVHPYGLFGPAIDFLVSKGQTTTTDNTQVNATQTQLTGDYKTVLFSLNVGAGADMALTRALSAMVDVRYSIALSNALSSTPVNQNQDVSLKNSGLMIMTGVQYAL